MKILIRGAGFENKGAEAMLRVVQRELGNRIAGANFYATVLPREAPIAYRMGITPLIFMPKNNTKSKNFNQIVSKITEFLRPDKNPDIIKAIKTSQKSAFEIEAVGTVDAVVDVSGFAYGDAWGTIKFKNTWAWVEYCESKRKPYIFLPQAWGPFEDKDVSFWAMKICNSQSFIVSRDDVSTKYLANIQGISADRVRTSPDIAFRFRCVPKTVGDAALCGLGLVTGKRPLIGLVPNMRVYERTVGSGSENHYVKLLIELADYFIKCLGANILLASNEISVPGVARADDRYLCGIIESSLQQPEYCVTIRDYLYSETVKSILGHVDLLIASRFHSLVFALSQGVPVLALGWSHKYQELLRPFSLENYVVDHDRLNTAEVISLVEKAWGQRVSTGARIRETFPHLQSQVDALFDEVAGIIREANR